MSNMTAQTHLFNRNGNFYFRAKIPIDLQGVLGKKEEKFSLKTKTYPVAKRLAREASVAFDRKCQAVRERLYGSQKVQHAICLDESVIREICELWSFHALDGDEWIRQEGLAGDELNNDIQARSNTAEALRELLVQGKTDGIEIALQQFLYLLGIEITGNAETWRRLRYRFLQTVTETHKLQIQRDAGEVVWTPKPPKKTSLALSPVNGATLQDSFKDWKCFEQNRPDKTVDDVERTINEFQRVVGKKSVQAITRKDMMAYRDHLVQVVKHKSGTIKKKIGFLSAIFNVAIEHEKLKSNPAWRIPIPKDDREEREPYSIDDLKIIFGSPLFTSGERLKRNTGEAGVWLPLLSLFHGCREEELGQLLVNDVACIDNIWCLMITEYNDQNNSDQLSKQLKTRTSKRWLPLHPVAIHAGFLHYVETVRKAGHQRIFYTLRPDRYNKLTSGFSKAYHEYLRDELGITNPNKVFHSFRHTFRDACREADFPEELADAMMGHSDQGKTGRRYGRRGGRTYSLKKLHEAICRIEYPGLDVPIIICADK